MDEFDPKFSLKRLQRKNGTWCVQATQSFAQSQYIGPFISEPLRMIGSSTARAGIFRNEKGRPRPFFFSCEPGAPSRAFPRITALMHRDTR